MSQNSVKVKKIQHDYVYFCRIFVTSHIFLSFIYFLTFPLTAYIRQNLCDVIIVYGCEDRGWV